MDSCHHTMVLFFRCSWFMLFIEIQIYLFSIWVCTFHLEEWSKKILLFLSFDIVRERHKKEKKGKLSVWGFVAFSLTKEAYVLS